jgi:hypothetical protein
VHFNQNKPKKSLKKKHRKELGAWAKDIGPHAWPKKKTKRL